MKSIALFCISCLLTTDIYNKMPDITKKMNKNIPVQMQGPRYDEGFDYVCSHVHTSGHVYPQCTSYLININKICEIYICVYLNNKCHFIDSLRN